MPDLRSILIVQTAFVGDVILTLPLVQAAKRHLGAVEIDMLVVPQAAELLANHPAVRDVVVFDKRGEDDGLRGLLRMVVRIRRCKYDLAIVPHRSLRSAVLVWLARIPRRIGFRRSAGRMLLTDRVAYDASVHEIDRNLTLLSPVLLRMCERELPSLYPSYHDRKRVNFFLSERGIQHTGLIAGIAPGTVWNTKRWHAERFACVAHELVTSGYRVVLIGGPQDVALCEEIDHLVPAARLCSAAGRLTLLQSAELIRRCKVLVANDSAPMHLAVAVGTPVVAIFGATVPQFGFAPIGENDRVIETEGLSCRPCTIHGGDRCPIRTFDCMEKISVERVVREVQAVLRSALSSFDLAQRNGQSAASKSE